MNCEESISTLKFADRAKQVMVQAVLNETRPVDHALVQRLQAEVESLKAALKKLLELNSANANKESGAGFALPLNQVSNLSASYGKLSLSEMASSHISNLVSNAAQTGPNTTMLQPLNPIGGGSVRSSLDLNTVGSLEKALNKEQSAAQHLLQKNETLIRELEALKAKHYQLILHQDELVSASQSRFDAQQRDRSERRKQQRDDDEEEEEDGYDSSRRAQKPGAIPPPQPNMVHITPSQASQVQRAVEVLSTENASVWGAVDSLQGVMKRFFKYELEEDDMRDQCAAVSDTASPLSVHTLTDN